MRRATPRPQGGVPGCPNPRPSYLSGPVWPRSKRRKRGKRCARPPWLGAGAGARRSTVSAGGPGGGGEELGRRSLSQPQRPAQSWHPCRGWKGIGEARLITRTGGGDHSGPKAEERATLPSRVLGRSPEAGHGERAGLTDTYWVARSGLGIMPTRCCRPLTTLSLLGKCQKWPASP